MSSYYRNRIELARSLSQAPDHILHTAPYPFSNARASSEFSSGLVFGHFGAPERRTSHIEIRHSSPFLNDSGFYTPRTKKRVISISSLHSRDSAGIILHGEDGDQGRIYSDRSLHYPSSGRESCPRIADVPNTVTTTFPSITRLSDIPRGYSLHRYRRDGPIRYSNYPRFSSRFLH